MANFQDAGHPSGLSGSPVGATVLDPCEAASTCSWRSASAPASRGQVSSMGIENGAFTLPIRRRRKINSSERAERPQAALLCVLDPHMFP